MADLTALLDDLAAESADLDALVSDLSDMQWYEDTPAAGWTIATQIAHLAWTDQAATLAATDAAGFQREIEAALPRIATFVDEAAFEKAEQAPDSLLDEWRAGRVTLRAALTAVPDGTKLPWFGPPMSAASMATARMMETFGHGQDVMDTLGVTRVPTDRLRHIAHIGVRTRNFAYMVRNLPAPDEEFRIELTGPRGDAWTWGPEDAAQRVTGPALDFCLLVTQRRHRDDLALVATGADANAWLDIAQAFAGPPGEGRKPAGAR